MQDETYRNTAVALLAAVMLLLWAAKKFKPVTLVAIGIIVGMTFLTPFLGFILAIPIFLVVYMDNRKTVLPYWDRIKNATWAKGGKEN